MSTLIRYRNTLSEKRFMQNDFEFFSLKPHSFSREMFLKMLSTAAVLLNKVVSILPPYFYGHLFLEYS